LIKTCCV